MSCEARRKTPPFSEWEPFSGIESGDFYAKDMAEVRETLFKHNHIPKITLGHKGESTRKLTLHLPGGKCTIRQIDEENSAQIAKFVEGHGLEYIGQSLPAAVQTVLFKLLKPQGEYLSKKEHEELYAEQKGKVISATPP